MRAVSNSSVLIALSTIGQLSLLYQRFPDGVLLPQAVWGEVVTTGAGQPLRVRQKSKVKSQKQEPHK